LETIGQILEKIASFPLLGSSYEVEQPICYQSLYNRNNTMTTNPTYNPLRLAFAQLTTPDARRWYLQQAKATAALAYTIALRSIAVVQRLLKPTSAIPKKTEAMQVPEAIAQPETIPALDAEVDASAIAEDDIPTLLRVSGGDAEDELEDAIAYTDEELDQDAA
jgi:hypothetical protein